MILLTGLYHDADAGRRNELLECLRLNAKCERLDEIHLFVEDAVEFEAPRSLNSEKIRLIQHGRRLTFQFLFDYASRNLADQTVIIANADIYFDETLSLLDSHNLSGRLLCLSRWDIHADGSISLFEHPSSQDAWIFCAPLPHFACDFPLGVLGCDNRLAWEAQQAGLRLSNPSRTLRAHHLHVSQVHRYTAQQRLRGPGKSIPAVFLETPYPGELGEPEPGAAAAVAFHESMGYTVARLEAGALSHNNQERRFTSIPDTLASLTFTQVVAFAVSPVQVEFRSPGKLYVLVGNDWEGFQWATSWLSLNAYREPLPLVETDDGTGFEIWSLAADAGQRFVIPTQVMLVADSLERNSAEPSKPVLSPAAVKTLASDPLFALTSLGPGPDVSTTADCLQSWRSAGLEVLAFNHPSEIAALEGQYKVDFVPVPETSERVFGRHFVPIKAMLEWAREKNAPVLIINADIHLQMAAWEMKRLRWLSDGGVCAFVRHNHDGDFSRATREHPGLDAFLFHGRDAVLFADSFLSMGQPFWDYWIPYTFASQGRPLCFAEFPVAFHRRHPLSWSWATWHQCALEFDRLTGELGGDQTFVACHAMSGRVRAFLDQKKVSLTRSPRPIREWVQEKFAGEEKKTFLELGAHRGTDTLWLAEIPEVIIYAFEPDPRNQQPPRPNVSLQRAAIADHDDRGTLILSKQGWGQEWTHSSSIKQPRNHLLHFPVTFGETMDVELVALDSFCRRHSLGLIDFIWADIQGAEGEMIRGGRQTLSQTRYLYTGYSDDELYEGQVTLAEILEMLPDFRVLELWPDEVLLENTRLQR